MWSLYITATLVLTVHTVVSTGIPRCKEGFVNIGEWCFSFHLQGASFPKSREICNETGGEMVVLDSEEKEKMLTEYMEAEGFTYKLTVQNREELLKSHHRKTIADRHGDRFCDFYKKYSDLKTTEELYTPNAKFPANFNEYDRANLTTPLGFSVKLSSIPKAELGAWATTRVPIYSVLGVYDGEEFLDDGEYLYAWTLNSDDENLMTHFVDGASPAKSNWLRYFNCARNDEEENVNVVLCDDLVFYMTSKDVAPNTELLTWYGTWYGNKLGIRRVHPEDDLDLSDVFYIRVSSLRQDYLGKSTCSFHDNSTATYTNWIPKKHHKLREREYWEDVREPFGLLLSYIDRRWNWVPEKDYSYFTGDTGLLLPFICEDRSNVKQ